MRFHRPSRIGAIRRWKSVLLRPSLHLRDDTSLDPAKVLRLVQVKGSTYKLTPDMRLTRRAKEGEVFASGLEATDRLLSELAGCQRSA